MKKEKIMEKFGDVINLSLGSFFTYPLCVWVWAINILATAGIYTIFKQDIFLVWMMVIFVEIILIIIFSSYVNFFWLPKRKKTE